MIVIFFSRQIFIVKGAAHDFDFIDARVVGKGVGPRVTSLELSVQTTDHRPRGAPQLGSPFALAIDVMNGNFVIPHQKPPGFFAIPESCATGHVADYVNFEGTIMRAAEHALNASDKLLGMWAGHGLPFQVAMIRPARFDPTSSFLKVRGWCREMGYE